MNSLHEIAPPKHLSHHESDDINDIRSKKAFTSLSDENYAASIASFPKSLPNLYNDPHSLNPDGMFADYNAPRKPEKHNNNRELQSHEHASHQSTHHSHSHNHQSKPTQKTLTSHATIPHSHPPEMAHSKASSAFKNYSKIAKKKARKILEKKTHFSTHDSNHIKMQNSQPRFDRNERSDPGLVSQGMSFGNPPVNKTEAMPSFPQQYFSIVSLDKDIPNNRRSCHMPQIYQAQPYNTFFYNGPQENNYLNNNVISTNNFCFQSGNANHFVGVNYPNVQNIAFTKPPNNYQAYGVMELNNDGSGNQYGYNYMNDNRSFQDKNRNPDYWKQQTYYTYNSQN